MPSLTKLSYTSSRPHDMILVMGFDLGPYSMLCISIKEFFYVGTCMVHVALRALSKRVPASQVYLKQGFLGLVFRALGGV